MAQPFRFGIAYSGEDTASRSDMLALARRIESLGYSSMQVPDHYVSPVMPIAAMMAIADAAPTLRVGTYVFNNDFRHPALLAKEMAALDLYTDGRLELGIGAGWNEPEYTMINLPFDPPAVRVRRLTEAVTIIKAFFTQTHVNFTGEFYTIRDLPALPHPVQRPHPPIFIGGGGRHVLKLAATQADIVGIHLKVGEGSQASVDNRLAAAYEQKISWVRAAAGDRFTQLELNILVSVIVTDAPQQAAIGLQQENGWHDLTPADILAMPNYLIGDIPTIITTIQARREHYGFSYITLRGADLAEPFAPVVAALAGR